jgi:hypothetical protein
MAHRGTTVAARVVLIASGALLAACSVAPATPPATSPAPSTAVPSSPSPGGPSVSPSGPFDSAIPDPPTSAATSADAVIARVGDAQWARIVAAGMARKGCPMRQTDLRRVEVNHWTFDGDVERGVLVVNADVARSVSRIFTQLFDVGFPITQMRPLEEYAGDNEKSMADDNTAAFNCRNAAQANAPALTSPHANGRAIDVNPVENPWMDPRCTCWSPSDRFGTVRVGPGVITEGSVAWSAFTREGWIWQDIDVADYMHFDTGYPTAPWGPSASPSTSSSPSRTTSPGRTPSPTPSPSAP